MVLPSPQLAHVAVALVHGQLAGADGVKGGRVAGVLEVRAIRVRAVPARLRDCVEEAK